MAPDPPQHELDLEWRHAAFGHYVARNGCEVNADGWPFFGRRWWAMVPNVVNSKIAGWRALSDGEGVAQFKTGGEAMRAVERFCAAIDEEKRRH